LKLKPKALKSPKRKKAAGRQSLPAVAEKETGEEAEIETEVAGNRHGRERIGGEEIRQAVTSRGSKKGKNHREPGEPARSN